MVVERVEELLFCPCRDGRILHKRIRHIVRGHAVQQELVVRFVLWFVLVTLEVGADEVPESVAYQCIKVLHTYDVSELFQQMGLAIAELHARRDVFLDVLQFYFGWQSRVGVIVVGRGLGIVDLKVLVVLLLILVL